MIHPNKCYVCDDIVSFSISNFPIYCVNHIIAVQLISCNICHDIVGNTNFNDYTSHYCIKCYLVQNKCRCGDTIYSNVNTNYNCLKCINFEELTTNVLNACNKCKKNVGIIGNHNIIYCNNCINGDLRIKIECNCGNYIFADNHITYKCLLCVEVNQIISNSYNYCTECNIAVGIVTGEYNIIKCKSCTNVIKTCPKCFYFTCICVKSCELCELPIDACVCDIICKNCGIEICDGECACNITFTNYKCSCGAIMINNECINCSNSCIQCKKPSKTQICTSCQFLNKILTPVKQNNHTYCIKCKQEITDRCLIGALNNCYNCKYNDECMTFLNKNIRYTFRYKLSPILRQIALSLLFVIKRKKSSLQLIVRYIMPIIMNYVIGFY